MDKSSQDNIKEPTHYTYAKPFIECRDARALFNLHYFSDTIKYVWRAPHKDNLKKDLKKADQCLSMALEHLENFPEVVLPVNAHKKRRVMVVAMTIGNAGDVFEAWQEDIFQEMLVIAISDDAEEIKEIIGRIKCVIYLVLNLQEKKETADHDLNKHLERCSEITKDLPISKRTLPGGNSTINLT